MSTSHKHIHYELTKAIYTALSGNVTVSGTTYPVYQSVPSTPVSVYVRIGEIIDRDNGTKDDYVYEGTITIMVNDESQIGVAERKLSFSIMDKVRSLLKTSRTNVLSMTGFTMITFTPDTSSEIMNLGDGGKPQILLIDIYRFIIQ